MPHLDHRPDRPGAWREMRSHDGVTGVLEQAHEERGGEDLHPAVAHGIGSAVGGDRDDDLGGGASLDLHGRAFTAGAAGTASPSRPGGPRSLPKRPGPTSGRGGAGRSRPPPNMTAPRTRPTLTASAPSSAYRV